MTPLLADSGWDSISQIVVSAIAIIPALLAAIWARKSQQNSSAALHEVRTNGGMSDPNPNLNDHVKYQTEMLETVTSIAIPLSKQVQDIDDRFTEHLGDVKPFTDKLEEISEQLDSHMKHSEVMDQALAEVYLTIRPDPKADAEEESGE